MIFGFPSIVEAVDVGKKGALFSQVGEDRVLCRVMGRLKFYTDSRDISQMPHLACDGIYDVHMTALLLDLVKPGMVCCDVGACFGYSALLMAEAVGPRSIVYAFEPHPRVFVMLKHNSEINGYSQRIVVYPDAAGDTVGKKILHLHKRRFDGATMSERAQQSFKENKPIEVSVVSLDERILDAGRKEPDLYQIGTVGYEPEVWRGMQGLLRNKRKLTIIMSFTPKWYQDAATFAEEILNSGFSVCRIEDNHLLPVTGKEELLGRFRSDLLLTR